MNREYKGTIIEESLEDPKVLNDLEVVSVHATDDENPADRWHIYSVKVSKQDIMRLCNCIKPGKWYMHFWKGTDVVAVFKDKVFEFDHDIKSTWKEVVDYGRQLGIPEEQLDFIIEA